MHWIVKLEANVWLADGEGDPPRTLVCANARTFYTHEQAKSALRLARQFKRTFDDAQITSANAE